MADHRLHPISTLVPGHWIPIPSLESSRGSAGSDGLRICEYSETLDLLHTKKVEL